MKMESDSPTTLNRPLYLHGLGATPTGEKVDWLHKQFTALTPHIDYLQSGVYESLREAVVEYKPDFLIGSSVGGYMAYFLAGDFDLPVVLFNPALPYRNGFVTEVSQQKHPVRDIFVVIGFNDDVIKAEDNLNWILRNANYDQVTLRIKNAGHRISFEMFRDEILCFFR
ncbi:MAG: hypothetical protein KKA07_06515 [Bacteroidetes bacterium]|nr:hypothetical protein [Bacteroidota bacterium]MBU1718709.1 hypothetical protein [Bacteroidota bacterium]